MKNRKEDMYKKFWNTLLKEMKNYGIAHTEPDMFITDKEPAMIKSIEKLYPGKHVHCYFHQCQSIVRQLKSLGIVKYLQRLRKGNDNLENLSTFYEMFRKILALPMLPANFITKHYKQLEEELHFKCKQWMTKKELESLKTWTKYLSNEWFCTSEQELKKIPKFRKEIRNTNGSETTNRQINSSPYLRKRRSVVGVIMLCQKLEENVRLKVFNLERFKNEERFAFRLRNPKTVEKENNLKKIQDELEESNFSDINTYLNSVAEIFMPLKFKDKFQEMVSLLEVSETVLEKEDEDMSNEEKVLIEELFNRTISQTLLEIGTYHKLQLTTSFGRKITPCRRYYNQDFIN